MVAGGDVLAQNIEIKADQYYDPDKTPQPYSPQRTMRAGIVGFTVIGTQIHL